MRSKAAPAAFAYGFPAFTPGEGTGDAGGLANAGSPPARSGVDALDTPALPHSSIVRVISNRKAAYGLVRAAEAQPPIPTAYLALQPFLKSNPGASRDEYDERVAEMCVSEDPDVVVLAGWMHVLGERFLSVLDGSTRGDERSQEKEGG